MVSDAAQKAAQEAVLTVVVATEDDESSVRATLDGVLAQRTTFPVDVVVHDDASTDATRQILQEYADRHPGTRRRVLEDVNRRSQGVCVIEQLLLDVRTPFVALCDPGDVWTDPLKLEKQVAFMRANDWCAVSHHAVTIRDESGSEEGVQRLRTLLELPEHTAQRVPGDALVQGNFVIASSAVLRRSAVRDVALRAFHAIRPDDFPLFVLAAEAGDIGYLPDQMVEYRLHHGSWWTSVDEAARVQAMLAAYWFLAAHALEPLRTPVREHLLRMVLFGGGVVDGLTPMMDQRRWVQSLHDELAESRVHTTNLDAHIAHLTNHIAHVDAEARERDEHVTRLNDHIVELDRYIADLDQERQDLASQLDALRSSTSWRVTAPLRALTRRARRVVR